MEPLFPYMWAGFWVNAFSGAVLFVADAPKKAANPSFIIKLVLIAIAVVVMRAMKREAFPHSGAALPRVKLLAAASLVLWAGAITAGRLMAYTSPLK